MHLSFNNVDFFQYLEYMSQMLTTIREKEMLLVDLKCNVTFMLRVKIKHLAFAYHLQNMFRN